MRLYAGMSEDFIRDTTRITLPSVFAKRSLPTIDTNHLGVK
jgi:hypothetical protein